MKKWIAEILLIGSLGALNAWAATTQPHALGLVTAIIESKTLTEINSYAARAAGQLVYCSNCTRSLLCVSSGTASGAWTIGVATGTFVGGIQHCQ